MLTGVDPLPLLSVLAQSPSPQSLQPVGIIGFTLLSIVALISGTSDGLYHRISNKITYPAIVAGFLFHAIAGLALAGGIGLITGLRDAGIGFGAAFVPFFLLYVIGAIRGAADVKVMGAFGAILADWEAVLHALFYGFLAAALIAVGIVIARGLFRKTLSNIAMMATQVASKTKPDIVSVGPPIGLAIGLSIGAVLAGVELFLGVILPWGRL
ncbi:MAG: prepilin peptidase [Phycisphaeraceae bacterium]